MPLRQKLQVCCKHHIATKRLLQSVVVEMVAVCICNVILSQLSLDALLMSPNISWSIVWINQLLCIKHFNLASDHWFRGNTIIGLLYAPFRSNALNLSQKLYKQANWHLTKNISVYNNLPIEKRLSQSLNTFKYDLKSIKNWFLNHIRILELSHFYAILSYISPF